MSQFTHPATFTERAAASEDRQPTVELLVYAQRGDRAAREELLVRSLPAFQRWASRHLPASARDQMDTCDLVQKVALQTLRRLSEFQPEHAGSMPAYLRKVAKSRVCDEFRRMKRHPASVALEEGVASERPSPLALAMSAEAHTAYVTALRTLRLKDRRLLIARNELGWSLAKIAKRLGLPSAAAARMAVKRAQRRLAAQLACSMSSSD
ncbi:MAG TPA: sigma-70 family RNA polymerase sigma factor [Vicinamibacterales bacterium]|nr:sigma-70 family RNA polymerase sigma factor [Vicinamibacterales bacterium]